MRIAKGAFPPGTSQQERAQTRLAQKLDFINKPFEFSPKVRERYVDRFMTPLGKLTTKLARAAGVQGQGRIMLPEKSLRELAGEEDRAV